MIEDEHNESHNLKTPNTLATLHPHATYLNTPIHTKIKKRANNLKIRTNHSTNQSLGEGRDDYPSRPRRTSLSLTGIADLIDVGRRGTRAAALSNADGDGCAVAALSVRHIPARQTPPPPTPAELAVAAASPPWLSPFSPSPRRQETNANNGVEMKTETNDQ